VLDSPHKLRSALREAGCARGGNVDNLLERRSKTKGGQEGADQSGGDDWVPWLDLDKPFNSVRTFP
jgi:hypothetical protein